MSHVIFVHLKKLCLSFKCLFLKKVCFKFMNFCERINLQICVCIYFKITLLQITIANTNIKIFTLCKKRIKYPLLRILSMHKAAQYFESSNYLIQISIFYVLGNENMNKIIAASFFCLIFAAVCGGFALPKSNGINGRCF